MKFGTRVTTPEPKLGVSRYRICPFCGRLFTRRGRTNHIVHCDLNPNFKVRNPPVR